MVQLIAARPCTSDCIPINLLLGFLGSHHPAVNTFKCLRFDCWKKIQINNNLIILDAMPHMIKLLYIFSKENFHSRIFLSGFWFIVSSDILYFLRILKKRVTVLKWISFFFFFFFLLGYNSSWTLVLQISIFKYWWSMGADCQHQLAHH